MFSMFRPPKIKMCYCVSYCDILWLNTVLQILSNHTLGCMKIRLYGVNSVTHLYYMFSLADLLIFSRMRNHTGSNINIGQHRHLFCAGQKLHVLSQERPMTPDSDCLHAVSVEVHKAPFPPQAAFPLQGFQFKEKRHNSLCTTAVLPLTALMLPSLTASAKMIFPRSGNSASPAPPPTSAALQGLKGLQLPSSQT